MRQQVGVCVVVAVLAIGGAVMLACGGAPKPPMVPDDNADGGADVPAANVPAVPAAK